MADVMMDWPRLWQEQFAPRFDKPVLLDARYAIPRELIIPLYVWMRQEPQWSGPKTACRMGLDAMTQRAVDTHLARQYPGYVLSQWAQAEGGGWA